MKHESCWKKYTDEQLKEVDALAEEYRVFISRNKTEREFTKSAIVQATEHGYKPLTEAQPGDVVEGAKFWVTTHGKAIMLIHVGSEPLTAGFNVLGAHIDSPRLDIKQNPFYEKGNIAMLDTHYYGGIKNYQWVTVPLALHGVIVKKDGTVYDICIGENADDPVFVVTDLLVHLASRQMEKKASEVIDPEALDILIGNRPIKLTGDDDANKESPVKAFILQQLKKKYDIEEEDFLSAELCAVPAGEAREMGLDRSMILGYGQDDSVCAWTSMKAQFDLVNPKKCAITILVDKEEIGSVGASGMTSMFFENMIMELMTLAGCGSMLEVRRALSISNMISSDVNSAVDPNYAEVFDDANSSFCGNGMVFNKYTGSRGKSGANDADAEYIARLRAILDEAGVSYQYAELGRVGIGGGGTIAYIPAKYGMNVIDSGVSVLSMHAPWEVTSKADIYEAYCGYKALALNM